MTTEEFFKNKASKLELTHSERDRISKKHKELREKLREKLPVEDDFLTGSYARYTIIRPTEDEKFDVDFFLAFNKEEHGELDLPDLLNLVKDALNEITAEDEEIIDILEQKRSISVVYDDGFQIDVVPAIQIEKDNRYKIFDKRSQIAVESNPKLHGKNLTNANEATASNSTNRLVPVVKLLKSWKREKCEYLKSFHLELLTVEVLKDEKITSFSAGIAKFFNNVDNLLQVDPLTDPANDKNVIDSYLDDEGTRNKLLSLLVNEKKIANKAMYIEDIGDYDGAVAEWKIIFEPSGDYRFSSTGPIFINHTPSKPHCNV